MAADDGVGCNAARMPPAAAACDGSAAMHCCQRHWPWSRERRSLRPWSAAARCFTSGRKRPALRDLWQQAASRKVVP